MAAKKKKSKKKAKRRAKQVVTAADLSAMLAAGVALAERACPREERAYRECLNGAISAARNAKKSVEEGLKVKVPTTALRFTYDKKDDFGDIEVTETVMI